MNDNDSKQLYLLYLVNFLRDLNFIVVVLSPLMLNQGFSIAQYIYVVSFFRITQMIFSIPTGILSDRIKPKYSIIISAILFFISYLTLLFFSHSLNSFVFFNIGSAISSCFLLTSSNKQLKSIVYDHHLFIHKYSTKLSLRKLGAVISGLVSMLVLSFFSYTSLLYLQLFSCVILIIVAINLNSNNYKINNVNKMDWKRVFVTIKILPKKDILKIIALTIPFFLTLDVLFQPLLIKTGMSHYWIPFGVAIGNLLIFISINKSVYFFKKMHVNHYLDSFIPLIPLIAFILTNNAVVSLLVFPIMIFSRSYSVVEMGNFLNKIGNRQGVTESILNTILMLIVSLISFSFGWFINNYSFYSGICVLTLFLFILIISLNYYSHKTE